MTQSLFDYLGDRSIEDLIDAYKESPSAMEDLFRNSVFSLLDHVEAKNPYSKEGLVQLQGRLSQEFKNISIGLHIPPIDAFTSKILPDGQGFDNAVEFLEKSPELVQESLALAIETEIMKAPSHLRARLIGLQWQIDQIRAEGKGAYYTAEKISKMMWDMLMQIPKIYEEGLLPAVERVKALEKGLLLQELPELKPLPKAEVIPINQLNENSS